MLRQYAFTTYHSSGSVACAVSRSAAAERVGLCNRESFGLFLRWVNVHLATPAGSSRVVD